MKKRNQAFFVTLLLFTTHKTYSANWHQILNTWFNRPKPAIVEHHYYPSVSSADGLTENQARSYINQCVASLELALRPHIRDNAHLEYLKKLITDNIYNAHLYTYTSSGKRYQKDTIDQFISSAVVQYIEEKSYSYAYYKSKNNSVAKKIAESMRNNALATISNQGSINFESLAKFVGDSLVRAVDRAINHFDAPYQIDYDNNDNYASQPSPEIYYEAPRPSAPPLDEKLYPSEECCVCYESFDTAHRLFLKPCGHDICKRCALNWFWDNNK
ncbi:MAG: RING finger protein [bacterium]|nr:RING finger protein [bacterium]